MQTLLAAAQLVSYFALLTLAGYLLSRSSAHSLAVTTAAALLAFAIIQADQFLGVTFEGRAAWLARAAWAAYPLPVALWSRVSILLLPGEHLHLDRAWWTLVLPVTMLLIFGGWLSDDLVHFATRDPGPLYWTYALYNIVTVLVTLWAVQQALRASSPTDRARAALVWLRLAGIAFGAAMMILALGILPSEIIFVAVVFDVMVFGLVGVAYDAIAEGQSAQRDLTYTALKALAAAILLILPWLLAIWSADTWSFEMALALLVALAAAALGVTLQDWFERLIDALLFRRQTADSETRETLRILMLNAARKPDSAPDLTALDPGEFARLTRRALSHMPNLPRLAASPLTELSIVTARAGNDADTLRRAQELRAILAECVQALRPPDRGAYGTTDEWRFFNALYYPYVAGISPYRRSPTAGKLDDGASEVMEWFRAMVPQRTMHNWQNRGAELIAEILLEREQQIA